MYICVLSDYNAYNIFIIYVYKYESVVVMCTVTTSR